MIKIGYNYLGYDAMSLVNHECDNPRPALKTQMEIAHFPFLSANIKIEKSVTCIGEVLSLIRLLRLVMT